MHFDQREQAALRDAGLSTDDLEAVADAVADAAARDADRLESFFERETVYSDMDVAHSDSDVQEHGVDYLDLYTHAADIRGYLRFDTWGVWVADGRILSEDDGEPVLVELTLGPTVHDRVRFAPNPEGL
jgi:alpha-D-ribose 1-methylphosphonate 5-triphosphate diphosphatase PhnM